MFPRFQSFSVSELSDSSPISIRTACGLLQVSTLAMHTQASVHGKPMLAQEQLLWHADVLHPHVVSSSRLVGAGSFVMKQGVSNPSTISQPFPIGEGSSSIAVGACLQLNAW